MRGDNPAIRDSKPLRCHLGEVFVVHGWRALISRDQRWNCSSGEVQDVGRRMLGPNGKNGPIKREEHLSFCWEILGEEALNPVSGAICVASASIPDHLSDSPELKGMD